MFSQQAKPEKKMNINNPLVEKLLQFVDYIEIEFKNHPNLQIAMSVLECLAFIKINTPWIKYAIQNKETDPSIYTYPTDQNKQILRAHNDMAFHIIKYMDPQHAISDYDIIISSIENRIDDLMQNTSYAKKFIDKIQDSKAACMDYRLSFALEYLANPEVEKLHDIFQEFFAEDKQIEKAESDHQYLISHLITFFDGKLGNECLHDGKMVKLNWQIIKKYLEEFFYYDEEELNPVNLFQDALITEENNCYTFSFTSKDVAVNYFQLVKLSLDNDFYHEAKKTNIKSIENESHIDYQFVLTKAQFNHLTKTSEKLEHYDKLGMLFFNKKIPIQNDLVGLNNGNGKSYKPS